MPTRAEVLLSNAKPQGPLPKAKGRTRSTAGRMNGLEARYAQFLEMQKAAGRILWWKWDCMHLRLADNTHYYTDFIVMQANGDLEIHEVKGNHMEEDAWVKLKLIAEMYPFELIVVRDKSRKGDWTYETVGPAVIPNPNKTGPKWPTA